MALNHAGALHASLADMFRLYWEEETSALLGSIHEKQIEKLCVLFTQISVGINVLCIIVIRWVSSELSGSVESPP